MKRIKSFFSYFSLAERILFLSSVATVLLSYFLSKDGSPLSLIASLIGVTSLIFCAKGHPVGQMLIIVFASLYGIISYRFAYYGEMLTYVGMSLPMAMLALISWLRNPYEKGKAEVRVNHRLSRREMLLASLLSLAVTAVFYFILAALDTANLVVSTLSVTTSFLAVYFTFRRSPLYALAYAANDIVLIVLWTLASIKDPAYLSTLICFFAFLANDIYGFINWRRMAKKQAESPTTKERREAS